MFYGPENMIQHGLTKYSPVLTSGGFGPTYGKALAMGYVPPDMSKVGTEVTVKIRNKMQPAVVTSMPFTETNYFRVE